MCAKYINGKLIVTKSDEQVNKIVKKYEMQKEVKKKFRAGLINYNFQFVFIPQELVQNMTINYLLYRNCKDFSKK